MGRQHRRWGAYAVRMDSCCCNSPFHHNRSYQLSINLFPSSFSLPHLHISVDRMVDKSLYKTFSELAITLLSSSHTYTTASLFRLAVTTYEIRCRGDRARSQVTMLIVRASHFNSLSTRDPGSPVSLRSTWLRLSNPDASKAVCSLHPAKFPQSSNFAGVTGLEPATARFGDECATNCATPLCPAHYTRKHARRNTYRTQKPYDISLP